MRIIYNYTFNVTKKIKREEMIPLLLEYFKTNNLSYKEVYFRLDCYKEKGSNRKTYFEKLCDRDMFWEKYNTQYECDIAKNTEVIGVTNLEKNSWICNEVDRYIDRKELIDKIQKQLIEMPKSACNYRISFNDIKWSSSNNTSLEIQDQWTSSLYPLSSNITLWKDYLDNRFITLNFEMNISDYEKYITSFAKVTDCSYSKDVTFVLDELEKEKYSESYKFVKVLLDNIDRKVNLSQSEQLINEKLQIKSSLQKIFKMTDFKLENASNGSYSYSYIDKYNNKINILFDYEKTSRKFGATLTYFGAAYKHYIKFLDIDKEISNSIIQEYALGVLDKTKMFCNDYVPIIIEKYNKTPDWFCWN